MIDYNRCTMSFHVKNYTIKDHICHYLSLWYCSQLRLQWVCLSKGFYAPVSADGLNLSHEKVDPCCWLRSGFESPREQLVLNLLCNGWYLFCISLNKTIRAWNEPTQVHELVNFGVELLINVLFCIAPRILTKIQQVWVQNLLLT